MTWSSIYESSLLKGCKIVNVTNCGPTLDSTTLTLNELDRMVIDATNEIEKLCQLSSEKKLIVGCAFKNSLEGLSSFLLCVKNNWVYIPLDIARNCKDLQSTLLTLNADLFLCGKVIETSNTPIMYISTIFDGKIHIYKNSRGVDDIKLVNDSNWLDNLAYIISTSGTTGLRKHVLVSHEAILSNVKDIVGKMNLSKDEVIAQNTRYVFDPCFIEILSWLVTGSTLLLFPQQLQLTAESFGQLLSEFGVTFLQTTPSSLSIWGAGKVGKFLLSDSSSLRHLALGGERFYLSLLSGKSAGNKTRVYNMYGLTEMSCWATMDEVTLNKNYNGTETAAEDIADQYDQFYLSGVRIRQPLQETQLDFQPCSNSQGLFTLTLRSSKRLCTVLPHDISLIEFYSDQKSLFLHEIVVETRDLFQKLNDGWYFAGRMDNEIKLLGRRFNLDHLKELVVNYRDPETGYVKTNFPLLNLTFNLHLRQIKDPFLCNLPNLLLPSH